MATVASRVQFNISAKDQTAAAFASARRSMMSLETVAKQLRSVFAGALGGALISKFVRSLVEINRHVPETGRAVTLLQRAWQAFGLTIGESGFNRALIDVSRNLGGMLIGSNGLAQSIGRLMGGVLRGLGAVFEGIGRAIAFAYDNIELLKKAFLAFAVYRIAAGLVTLGRGFILLVASIRAAGIATSLFALAQRRALLIGLVAIAVTAKLTGTYDKLAEVINKAIKMGEELIPILGDELINGLNNLGVQTSSLTKGFDEFEGSLSKLPKTFAEVDKATKDSEKAGEKYRRGITDLKQFIVGLQDEGAALGKNEGALARVAQSQAFYNKMQDQGIVLTTGQIAAAEGWLNTIPLAVNALALQKDALQTAKDVGEAFKSSFSSAFASIVDGTSSVKKAFQNMVSSLLSQLTNLFANKAFAMLIEGGPAAGGSGGLVGALFKGIGGLFGASAMPTIPSLPSPTFGGPKAAGGPVMAGKSYTVGERGPETLVMGNAGHIIPSRGMGGTSVQIIDQRTTASPAVEQQRGSDGSMKFIIRDEVNRVIGSGGADKTLNARFGMAPRNTRR